MKGKILKLTLLLPALALFLAGCSISTTSTPGESAADASLFVSDDSGSTWQMMVSVPTLDARPQTITDLNVNALSIDPQDSRAVYLASFEQGLFYTYDVTKGWNRVLSLPQATVNDVKVDSKNKCVIYAALANRLYRSADCSRTWTPVYFDNNEGVAVTTIAIDHYNTRNLYIGTSRGEIIKSIDSGASWRTIQRLNEGLARLVISPQDSRRLFAATVKNRIYRFSSNTDTNPAVSDDLARNFLVADWTDMAAALEDYELGSTFKEIIISPEDGTVFLATEKLILRSNDSGATWENVNLVPPEKDAVINALTVNHGDADDIYYVTNTAFFHSRDGGATWATKSLPTKRAGRALLIDFKNPKILYLGTVKLKD